jgi:hypothetical protein
MEYFLDEIIKASLETIETGRIDDEEPVAGRITPDRIRAQILREDEIENEDEDELIGA